MVTNGVEILGGIGVVDNGEVLVLAENVTDSIIPMSTGISCGMGLGISETDVDSAVGMQPGVSCYGVSCSEFDDGVVRTS